MELDDCKNEWAAHGAILERSLAINERLLRDVLLRKVRWALAPFVLGRALEVALGVVTLVAAVPIFFAHLDDPIYLAAVGGLISVAAWLTWLCARLLVGVLQLDFATPVTALRRDVERLRIVEYRAFVWALLGGIAIWLPAALVLLEAVTGAEVLPRVDTAWLLGNVVLGVGLLGVGLWLSKRHIDRENRSPRAQRLLDALSGWALRRALENLTELQRFEREDSP